MAIEISRAAPDAWSNETIASISKCSESTPVYVSLPVALSVNCIGCPEPVVTGNRAEKEVVPALT